MNKTIKNKNILIFVISMIIFGTIIGYYFYLNNKIIDYKEKIRKLENIASNNLENNIDDNIKQEYNCNFTETFRIVNTLDGYIAEIPELSYIIVDKFQTHFAYAYYIPIDLKRGLEEGKYYEFTYNIKGNGIINDMEDVYSYMIKTATWSIDEPELKVTLTIKETDKEGLNQVNEPICK